MPRTVYTADAATVITGQVMRRVLTLALILTITTATTNQILNAAEDFPHFASLRSERVNVRTGPGEQYPISWVYVRKGLPVEVTASFYLWRKIRDIDDEVGWIYAGLLSKERTVIIMGKTSPIYRDSDITSSLIALAEPGVIGRVLQCRESWCELDVDPYHGWIHRTSIWGIFPDEEIK